MDRKVRWMRILRNIQSNEGVATQRSIVKATEIGRSKICQDLRELGMWYHKYVEREGNPLRYSLTVYGHFVVRGKMPLVVSDRTRCR